MSGETAQLQRLTDQQVSERLKAYNFNFGTRRITGSPKVDGTDFYMFRSYESGRQGYVTLIANYLPLQDAYGGPNSLRWAMVTLAGLYALSGVLFLLAARCGGQDLEPQ